MGLATNGLWEIEVHYNATLAPVKDAPDGLKSGLYEAALLSSTYHPGKTPLHTFNTMAFMAPNPMPEEFAWNNAVNKHPALVKECDNWNAKELFMICTLGYEILSKKPINKVEDFKGVRVRALPDMGKPLAQYGAVIEMVPAPEIYTALERGMLDAVFWVWPFTFGAYRLYELAPYATLDIAGGKTGIFFVVNKDAFNALPKEWQDKATWWGENRAQKSYENWMARDTAKWLPVFAEAGIKISHFPPEERAKLLKAAELVWQEWAKRMEDQGLPGNEVLDFALAKKAELEAAKKK